MSWLYDIYEYNLFPILNDLFITNHALRNMRETALRSASGKVIEIGFGTGLSAIYYPETVESIIAIDPNKQLKKLAASNLKSAHLSVDLINAVSESIPITSKYFDTAISVMTLCTVADPDKTLMELHRVLRDDGQLLLMEHGLSDDPRISSRQNKWNSWQNILACGSNLNRPMAQLVKRNGFEFVELNQYFAPTFTAPRTHRWFTIGRALKSVSFQKQNKPSPYPRAESNDLGKEHRLR